jgi:hypothetical protein
MIRWWLLLAAAGVAVSACSSGQASLARSPGRHITAAAGLDPPGKHIAPSAEPMRKPMVLNWIGAFVSVQTTRQPFCDFGRAANLPPLPVFGS